VQSLVARTSESGGDAAGALHAEVVRLRGEIADLEMRAEERHAKGQANGAALAANRDPEKGLVLIENFRHVGRSSPSAVFQTMVWAATKGDDQLAASLLTFDVGARAQAEALISALPEGVRAKYPSPESLAALFFAEVVTGHEAARILSQTLQDPQHATVTIGFTSAAEGQPLTMQWGATGWQLVVPGKAVEALKKRMSQTVVELAKP